MGTYQELYQKACKLLSEHEIADAKLDAWYLFSHAFHMNRTAYLLNEDKRAEEAESLYYMELIKRRAEHIPLQYITGTQEFMGLEFAVTPDVLIPRQDTEILAEEALKLCEGRSVLDLCTGSGCIIISIARLGKPARTTGTDISPKALKVATDNAARLGARTEFIQSDLLERVEGSYDIIVSNPPYIPTGEIETLMPEVKDHEPVLALDGDEDGLRFYRRIAAQSREHLRPNGRLLLEIGYNQGKAVKQILTQEGFADISIRKDLSGHDRVVTARNL